MRERPAFGHGFLHDSLPVHDHRAIRSVTRQCGRIGRRTTAHGDLAEHVHALQTNTLVLSP